MDRKKEVLSVYRQIKPHIEKRLRSFRHAYAKGDDDYVFHELAFCILTPQSKAKMCWSCMEDLKCGKHLYNKDSSQIESMLRGVRFQYKKAGYLIEARDKFLCKSGFSIKEHIESFNNVFDLRQWLAGNIKGYGLKEASHFLRNIGKGSDIAILDRHILKNLKAMNVLKTVPSSVTGKAYIDIENKMRLFAGKEGIPMDHMDILLWYMETGEIFK